MKKVIYTLMLIACTMLASCTSDDEPNWQNEHPNIDEPVMDALKSGNISKQLSFVKMECFDRESTNAEWKKSTYNLVGHKTAPGRIYIKDGKQYTAYSIFTTSIGGDRLKLFYVWNTYQKETNTDISFYIYTPFAPDLENMSWEIDNIDYTITALSDSHLTIDEITYHDLVWIKYTYELSDLSQATNDQNEGSTPMAFESKNAIYQYIIDKAREEFGDVIDYTKLYGEANYLFPTIDLNELQESLDNNRIY